MAKAARRVYMSTKRVWPQRVQRCSDGWHPGMQKFQGKKQRQSSQAVAVHCGGPARSR